MEEKDASLKTVQRYVEVLKKGVTCDSNERRRCRMAAPNEMWQTDTSTGPYIILDGKKYRTYLIMFIDDHSRLIPGYGFYHALCDALSISTERCQYISMFKWIQEEAMQGG